MSDMDFAVLGPTVLTRSGATLAIGDRLRTLVTVLLASAGRPVSTDRLLLHLYGDVPADARRLHALRAQVSRLRNVLGDSADLQTHPTGYSLSVPPERLDVTRFEQLVRRGELAAAARLWRGEFCQDLTVADPEIAAEQRRLTELRHQADEDRLAAQLASGPSPETLAELQSAVAAEPHRERMRALLVRALGAVGRQAEAIAAFEEARTALGDELGLELSPTLRAAHLAVVRQTGPRPVRRLVDRDDLLAELAEVLGQARLVTLTGPGGVGKTVLAQAAAASAGVETRFVDLATVPPGTDPADAVTDALGLKSDDPVQALHGRELLLVLDNCEHLAGYVARLAEALLNGCPGIRLLATSREALRCSDEIRFAVPLLSADGAVQLFAERARTADRSFRLTPATLPLVRRICELVDRLPLAVELAAGRVDAVPLEDIAGGLDRLELLDRGGSGHRRHDSLRATIAWSWNLLEPAERALAVRLAVFGGGATADSVAAVLDLPRQHAVKVLAGLTERSLLVLTNGRYRMLETIRAFAADQLDPAEADNLRGKHAAYLLELVDRAEPQLRGRDQLHWAGVIREEVDNLRAAVSWSVDHDPRLGLRLVAGLSTYWWMHGLRGEAARAARAVLPAVDDFWSEEYLLTVLHAVSSGQHDLADHIVRARAIVERLDRPFRSPVTVLLWSIVLGPYSAPALVAEVLDRNARSRDPWTQAVISICAGYPGLTDRGPADPEDLFQAALAAFQVIGDRWGASLALSGLADLAAWSDQLELAGELTGQALHLADQLNSDEDSALLLCRRGDLHLRLKDLSAAAADYRQALVHAVRAGLPDASASARLGLARAARYDGDLAAARELASAALAECPAGWVGADLARAEALHELAVIARADGQPTTARSWLRQAGLVSEQNRAVQAISDLSITSRRALQAGPGSDDDRRQVCR